jgi:transcription initiation factor TFIIIB Brf1 subunit/transcription initiation factor TFIIB
MAIICPKCGAQYDVTLFQFGRTVICDCGQIVDAKQPHQKPPIKNKKSLPHPNGNGKKPA